MKDRSDAARAAAGVEDARTPRHQGIDEAGLAGEVVTGGGHRPEPLDVPRRMVRLLLDHLDPATLRDHGFSSAGARLDVTDAPARAGGSRLANPPAARGTLSALVHPPPLHQEAPDMTESDQTGDAFEAARERYRIEREKRLRPEGMAQYKPLAGDYAEFDRDPYVEPGFTREPVIEETDVVIVGGGFAGMLTAIGLGRHGITDYRIIDKGGDFGGTWYWNRYPGCMCDVESYTYLPLLEETGYMPTEKYASAAEIFEYCQLMGRHFELYPHALFQTEIADAVWNDDTKRWLVTTSPRRSAVDAVPRDRRRHPPQGEAARHPRHRDLRRSGVPHQSVGLRLHRRRPTRTHGEAAGQACRHHRHRRHRRAGRASPGRDGRRAVRLPAHAVGGRRAQQRSRPTSSGSRASNRAGTPSGFATSPTPSPA